MAGVAVHFASLAFLKDTAFCHILPSFAGPLLRSSGYGRAERSAWHCAGGNKNRFNQIGGRLQARFAGLLLFLMLQLCTVIDSGFASVNIRCRSLTRARKILDLTVSAVM
jgi:hypothetical protein